MKQHLLIAAAVLGHYLSPPNLASPLKAFLCGRNAVEHLSGSVIAPGLNMGWYGGPECMKIHFVLI